MYITACVIKLTVLITIFFRSWFEEKTFCLYYTEWVKSRYTEEAILYSVYLLLAHSVFVFDDSLMFYVYRCILELFNCYYVTYISACLHPLFPLVLTSAVQRHNQSNGSPGHVDISNRQPRSLFIVLDWLICLKTSQLRGFPTLEGQLKIFPLTGRLNEITDCLLK